jgi:Na+-driven multidrug efflux pump
MQDWKSKEIFMESDAEKVLLGEPLPVLQPVPYLSFPDRKFFVHIVKLSLPLACVIWARMGTYCATTIRVTRLGDIAALAAHSILVRIYYFLGCVADGLGQTAQNYVPATLYPKLQKERYNLLLGRMVALSLFASIAGGTGALALLSKASTLFVADATVASFIQSASPFVAACLALHAFSTLLEGVMIAKRDFWNLVVTYTVTFSAHLLLLLRANDLPSIWMSLVWWQILRVVNLVVFKRK